MHSLELLVCGRTGACVWLICSIHRCYVISLTMDLTILFKPLRRPKATISVTLYWHDVIGDQ